MNARWTESGKPIPYPEGVGQVRHLHKFLTLRQSAHDCIICGRDLLDPIHTGRYTGQDPDEYDPDEADVRDWREGFDTMAEYYGER